MRRRYLFSLLLFTFVVCFFCAPKRACACVNPVDSYEALKNHLFRLDTSSLVVLDVDEVLLTDQDAILSPFGDSLKFQIHNEYFSQAKTDHERQKIADTLNLPLFLSPKKLVEASWPEAISLLLQKGVKVIALTSCPVEDEDKKYNLERWRIEQLQSLGISFAASFPDIHRFELPLKVKNKKNPLYSEGILFTGQFSKAEVLSAFLDHMNWKPHKIIFVDNLLSNVQQMEIKLIQKEIPHLGFHYQYVEKKGKLNPSPDLARKQFEHLFKYQEWLHDDEAKALYFPSS